MGWWVLAEFASGEEAVAAARDLRLHGHRQLDAFTPYPVEGMREALDLPKSWVRWVALGVGAGAAATGYFVQWWTVAWDWPLNVGNRPPHAYPAFVPITFESLVLFASLAILASLLVAWRLPTLHHAVFHAPRFRSATRDGFWVGVREQDPDRRDAAAARLSRAGPRAIDLVDEEVVMP